VPTKRCYECKRTLPTSEFRSDRARKDGLQNRCAECVSAYNAAYYERTKERHREARAACRDRAIATARAKLWELLSQAACLDCGETDPVVLEFDHQHSKRAGVGLLINRGHSWDTVEKEIAKCEIVCSNCHRRRTSKQFGWWQLAVDTSSGSSAARAGHS
jgi:5-methylcytosine-specific restriction endonuclease McrA